MIRRASHWLDRHPLVAIALGYLLIVVIALVAIPSDPDYIDAAVHAGRTT